MKPILKLTFLLLLTCAMTACPDSGQNYSRPAAAKPPDPAPKIELEKKVEVEQQLRHQTEARLAKQESTTSQWQTLAMCGAAGAVVLLIVGTALGSKARHDASTPRP